MGALEAALDVGVDNAVVDERCKRVHEEHCEHGTLGVAAIVDANENGENAGQETIDELASFRVES